MNATKTNRNHWVQVGRDAFANGDMRAPIANPAIRAAIDGLQVGEGASVIMRAFIEGWDAANMEAPVE
ncbi:hypothetical protein [Nocardia brasiliensis]|uniref:hypothetical protein n=1 Tax=Nocardia brasiliensis TaxID=37326 RepID=UPI002453E97D|nr:hypothetical protein [Nocardia brasiliensis]